MIAAYSAVIFFVVLDRFLKILSLSFRDTEINIIGEALKFNYQPNYYIAFSLPLAGRFLNILITIIVLILIGLVFYYYRRGKYFQSGAASLIAFGAASNLLDRIKYGSVIDYLDLKYFTVFNLADLMIVCGTVLFISVSYKKEAQ